MRRSQRRRRPAFTLLEVLLSSVIGVLLMGALYSALSMQLRHAQAGRDVVEQSLLVRSIIARMGSDVRLCLAPALPPLQSSSGGSSGQSGGGSGGTSGAGASSTGGGTTGGSSSTSGSGSTSSGSGGSSSGSGGTTTALNAIQVNLGVQGDSGRLIVFVSRVPRDLYAADGSVVPGSDLRRIGYWLNDSMEATGLCRQEAKMVTSDDVASNVPPDVQEPAQYLMAEEVKSLQFQYFDGSAWQDTWDSTAPGADGTTPMGPPAAIAVTLGVAVPGTNGQVKTYRHVIALATANGQPQTTTTTTTGTSN